MSNADSALRALVERQKWFEEQIASGESEWIDFWQERFEDGDDVPDKEHFVSLWLAERCAELLAAPQAAPAEDEQDDRDVPVWTLIKLLKECGGVEDEGENGRFWTLDLNTVYSLEKLLNDYGTDVGYANCRKPLAAPAGMVLVPNKRLPDDGNGDDDAYNAGWNACRAAMLAAAPAAQGAVREPGLSAAALIVRDVCESDPADPDDPNTVCVNVDDLLMFAQERISESAAPAVVVDDAMIDAALFCTPRGGSMDEDLAMPIDFMGLGQLEKLPLARQVMGAALAAALNQGKANG